MSWEKFFSYAIRLIFVIAFGSFLSASLHHVAYFFHNFEPPEEDWLGSYALAVSIDGTAIVMTAGLMFFSETMPRYAQVIVWFFVVALTGFSWLVNWQYAQTFQQESIRNLDPFWYGLNPILASSFAFLNLAYNIAAKFFNARPKTIEELRAELAEKTGERAELLRQLKEAEGPGLIARVKKTAIELKEAVNEVVKSEENTPVIPTQNQDENSPISEHNTGPIVNDFQAENERQTDRETDPEMPRISPGNGGQNEDEMPASDESVTQGKITRPLARENNPKWLTPAQAAQLEICRKKGLKSAQIKAAILAGELPKRPGGKLAKTAVEKWAKTQPILSSVS